LSGSDGTLKMWDIRDGTVIRDLLTGIVGVWQVVFEGRWCVAASNRQDATVLDVWDFGTDELDGVDDVGEPETIDWVGEPATGMYDEYSDDEEDEEEAVMMDVMDQDSLDAPLSEKDPDERLEEDYERMRKRREELARVRTQMMSSMPGSSSSLRVRSLPPNDDTPTRPRIRHLLVRRR